MSLDPDSCDPAELARLARLRLQPGEAPLFTRQLRQLIGHFNRIADLPTDGVAPFAHHGDRQSTVRADEAASGAAGESRLSVPSPFANRQGDDR